MASNLNSNKIAAAILLAGLIGMVAGKVTDFLYDGAEGDAHHGEHVERGYQIEVTEAPAGAGTPAAPVGAADISALLPTADAAAGGAYFAKKCAVCHTVEKGGANKVGPHLYGVMGRNVAGVSEFNYSKAMKEHAAEAPTWDWASLNHFLWNPKKTVPGTLMAYAGTSKDSERANLIAYLNTMTDTKQPLPPVTTPEAADAASETPAEQALDAAVNPAINEEAPSGAKTGTSEKAATTDSEAAAPIPVEAPASQTKSLD